jgi:hypothetical protein
MNRKLLLLFIFLHFSSQPFAQCNNNDSVVVRFGFVHNDWTNVTENHFDVYVYDLDSGLETSYSQICPFGGSWQQMTTNSSTFWRYDTIVDANGWPVEIITREGTGSDWNDRSKKIITYNNSYYRTGLYDLQWNVSAWDTNSYQTWTYDSNDNIISSSSFYSQNNIIIKNKKVDRVFLNGLIDSKINSAGDANNLWKNINKYKFNYSNGHRISAELFYADSTGAWISSSIYQYFLNDSAQYVIQIVSVTPLASFPQVSDTNVIELDTLENEVHQYGWSFGDTTSANSYNSYSNFSDSTLLPLYSYSQYWQNWSGTLIDIDRPSQIWYHYDSLNHLVATINLGACTNPCGGEEYFTFDQYGRTLSDYDHDWTMVTDNYNNNDYLYIDSSKIKIIIPPVEDSLLLCPDINFTPEIFVFSSCSPYHVQWTPSTGLSSDTVVQPSITVTSPITYTIYAYDNFGSADTAYYTIGLYPANNHISVANTYCDGSVELSLQQNIPSTYHWYFNGNIFSNNTNGLCNASQSGDYSCVSEFTLYGIHGFQCLLPSDTFTLIPLQIPQLSQQADIVFCSLAGNSFNWYLDSIFLTTTADPFLIINQTGNYQVTVIDTAGCTHNSNPLYALYSAVNETSPDGVAIQMYDFSNMISIINNSANSSYELSVTDITGKTIFTKNFTGIKNEIEFEYSSGIYFLQIRTRNSIQIKKIFLN